MEDLRHSLHRNHASATLTKKNSSVNGFPMKTAYDDVFGGPPKFSVPYLPSRIEDYGEIFGGFYAPKTSSIPFLDFPAAEEDDVAVDVRSSNFAYSEVFGGFSGGDFAVSYEELFMEPEGSESASTDDWIPAGADSLQQTPAVATRDPLEELHEDPFAYSENNQFMPDGASHHGTKQTPAVVTRDPPEELHEDPSAYSGKNQVMPDGASHHGTKQFSVSYHKTSHRTQEDAINGTTHIAQLHVVPGYTSFVDACSPPEKTKSVKTMPQLSNDSSLHVDFNEGTVEGAESGKTMLQNPSGSSSMMKTSGTDVKANQKQFKSENSASEDASANNQHHLHYSSSNHLISDGDRSYHDGVFLSVSEINLRTQPSHVPPPSRPPPKFVSRQGHSKGMMSANLTAYPDGHFHKPLTTDQAYPFGGGFETHVVKEAVKDISPPFFDVEVDLSSAAAAASAAAMKAMEQAQVRLKSAKESMERKRSNLQNCKKLGLSGNIKGMEKREKKIVQEAQKFKEGIVDQKAYEREKSEMKDFDGEEKRKATREALLVPDFEEKGRHIELDKEYLEKKQTKDSRIALDFFKPEESMGEWKAEKQFYELVKNEKFKVAEPFGWESNGSKLTETAMACEKKQKEGKATKDARKSDEAEGKLRAFKDGNEQEENDKKLKAAREACQRRDNEKILREPLEALEREETEKRLKAAQEVLEQEKNRKKTKSVQEALGREEDEKKLKAAEEALKREENEQILKAAQEVREQEENKKKLKAVQEALVRQENDRKLKAAQEALVREENEKKQKAAQEALVREENEKKLKAAQEALVRQENEQKLKAAQEALVREENEKKQKAAQEALMREENAKKLKMAQEALVRQEDEKKLKAAQEALMREENEKKQRAVQVALEREENTKKLKAAQDALVRQENERKLQAAQEALVREEHEKKLKAAQEALEAEKKLKAAQEALIREEHEKKLKAVQDALVQEENEKNHKVAQQTLVREENEKKLKAAQEIRQREEKEKNLKAATEAHEREKKLKADSEAREQDEKEKLIAAQEALGREENNKELLKTLEFHEHKENANNMEASNRAFQSADSQNEEAQGVHEYKVNENKMETALLQDEEKALGEAKKAIGREENEKKLKTAQVVSEQLKVSKMLKLDLETHEKKQSEKNIKDVQVSLECEENKNKFKVAQEVLRWIEKQKRLEAGQQANVLKEKGNILKTALGVTMVQDTRSKEKNMNETHITEERDKEEMTHREKEHEVNRLRKIEEQREREREREKDRIAVERATREAQERVVAERLTAESQERAAVERVTAEARQRAMSEARERAEKASAEAREKLFTEKTSMETRLRLERAAVERATAEARERAVEKAMAEKAARDRQKKDSEMEGFVGVDSSKDGHRQTYAHNQQFQSAGSTSSVFQRYSNHASYSSEKFQGAEGESATRCKARLERHQRTTERAAKALAEKNMRDVLAQREQAERSRLAETLDADVRRWSNGKEGNLRALLSTLQYILGPDSGWQPIPLTDVITAVAVKKAYRKATLCVHPDKLQQRGASIQQKYVCEKVFDLLKEAWNKFNSEER